MASGMIAPRELCARLEVSRFVCMAGLGSGSDKAASLLATLRIGIGSLNQPLPPEIAVKGVRDLQLNK